MRHRLAAIKAAVFAAARAIRAAARAAYRWFDPRQKSVGMTWHDWIALHVMTLGLAVGITLAGITAARHIHHGGYQAGGALPPREHVLAGASPFTVNLTRFLVRDHNQGNSNSCVGQTWSTVEEILSREHHRPVSFSAGFIWNQANGGVNQGITYTAAMGILSNEGDAPLAAFPADGWNDTASQPSLAALHAAMPYHAISWHSIAPDDVATMKAELAAGNPFGVAVPVTDSIAAQWGYNTIPTVYGQSGPVQFWHSMTAVGYDPAGLIIQNSWGPGFGDNDQIRLSWGFLQAVGADIVVAHIPGPPPPVHHAKPFPLARWNEYRHAHHARPISPYVHGHTLSYPATLWRKHESCDGITAAGSWHPAGRHGVAGYMKYTFRGCTLYFWPHIRGAHPKWTRHRWIGGSPNLARCAVTGKNCRKALVDLLNAERATHGLAPLALDPIQTKGRPDCAGAQSHSRAMAETLSIWHRNADHPADSFPAGICSPFTTAAENVGMSYGSPAAAIQIVTALMLSEPLTPGNHHGNIDGPYTRVGIGLARGTDGAIYITEDFRG